MSEATQQPPVTGQASPQRAAIKLPGFASSRPKATGAQISASGLTSVPRAVVQIKKPANKSEGTATVEVWEPTEDKNYSNTPSVEDQKINPRYAGTWMEGPLQFEEYDMSIPRQKAALNALMALKDPEGAPRAVIETLHTETFRKGWKFLVGYRKVQYKILVPRRVPVEKEDQPDETNTNPNETSP